MQHVPVKDNPRVLDHHGKVVLVETHVGIVEAQPVGMFMYVCEGVEARQSQSQRQRTRSNETRERGKETERCTD